MIKFIEKEEFYKWLKSLKSENLSKEDKHFISDMRIAPFYKCKMLAYYVNNEIMSILCYTITKGYFNIYYQYTLPKYRRNGATNELLEAGYSIETGNFDRIYVRASTKEIQNFYDKRGFKNFGIDKNGSQLREYWSEKNKDREAKSLKYIVNE